MIATGITNAGVEQPRRWRWTSGRGYADTRILEGVSDSALAAAENEFKFQGWDYEVEKEAGKWRLTATTARTEISSGTGAGNELVIPISETWELGANMVEKDILESNAPLMVALWGSSQSDFDANMKSLRAYDADVTQPIPAFAGSGAAAAVKLAQLLKAGARTVRVFLPTLRHTKIVSNKYQVKATLNNVGNIIGKAKIASLESIPSAIMFSLPQETTSGRSDALGTRLYHGWYKKYPTITQQSVGEFQIQQEFEWGLWHQDLYNFIL